MRNLIERNRREFLALGLGAAGALYMSGIRHSFAAGSNEFTVLSDGNLVLPVEFVFRDAPVDELRALLESGGFATDILKPDCNVTLLRSGERVVLFDVGAGANFMSSAGQLADSLAEAGISTDDITDVVFTHGHPDHLWGVIDDFDEPVFGNARYFMNSTEFDYWTNPDTLNTLPEERKSFGVGAASRLERISEMVELFNPGDEIIPGVEAVDTSGHTPGHTSFMVHGEGDPVMIIGDAIYHGLVSFEKPDWPSASDQDQDLAIKTRVALLDRLAADKASVIGFHFPKPGQGRVERKGSVYRYAPD